VLEALGAQHVGGAAVKWAGVFRGDERKVSLPLYPWQRKRYWMADVDAASGADVSGQSEVDREEPEGQVIGWRHGGEAEQRQALLRLVCSEAARVLSLASADDIDSTQPLSERGLDSLMALELRRGLVKKTGLSLPATLVYDYPAPHVLSDAILHYARTTKEEEGEGRPWRDRSTLAGQTEEERLVPLSAGQQRLWFMEKISNDLPINTIHHGLKFCGKLDIQRLHDCLALLVARHEALRTTFIDVPLYGAGQEMPRALIAPQGRVPLDVADLRGQPDALRQADRLA
ncbi:phosphopantetheine-binding protein, partial [Klebsiella aerogenes]